MSVRKRVKTPKSLETEVLQRSRRRCCLCVSLRYDYSVKKGQIAHLNKNPADNAPNNLAFLCLDHHDEYDSKKSVSKGFTEMEVKHYRDSLYATNEQYPMPSPTSVKLPLRREPIEVPEEAFMDVFGLHGNKRRPNEDKYILSEYKTNEDGLTVTDHATGLMWQQSGSDSAIPYKRVQTYVKQLNSEHFAGYSDWRLPTIEELISLREPKRANIKGYIDPIFDDKKSFCWSSDKRLPVGVYYFNFHIGGVYWHESTDSICYVRTVRSCQSHQNLK